MDDIPYWMMFALTILTTAALFFHGADWPKYRAQGRRWSHAFILMGWSVIVFRGWVVVLTDGPTISYVGALGLLLLSGGLVLRSLSR